jgi:hypothetical protein
VRIVLLTIAIPSMVACSCGPTPPPAEPDPMPAPADVATDPDAPAAPDAAVAPDPEAAAPASPDDPAAAAFRELLAAFATGTARAVRALIPADGMLVAATNLCRRPIYGVGTCREERAEAERQRVTPELLAPWLELFAAVASAGAFASDAFPVSCASGDDGARICESTVIYGSDPACRGEMRATVRARLRAARDRWIPVEIGYEEEILLCP